MNDDTYTLESGHLDVGDGHKIYYQRWGNPKKTPIFAFHGGPGSQSKDKHKLAFDPIKHHVIFHDQRGCGQSEYRDLLTDNTTHDLVSDIEKLRQHFGFDKIHIFGHSWGSTLALCYAIAHSEKVIQMIIGGVYTGTKAETDYLFQGGLELFFPEAWNRFIEIIPENRRNNTLKYYLEIFQNSNEVEIIEHMRHYAQLEPAPMSIDADYKKTRLEADSIDNLDLLNSVLIGLHYFTNNCFIDDGHITTNLEKLKNIPMVILQGRFDLVCRPVIATKIAEKLGDNCHLHIVPASHTGEGSLREVQRAYTWSFLA